MKWLFFVVVGVGCFFRKWKVLSARFQNFRNSCPWGVQNCQLVMFFFVWAINKRKNNNIHSFLNRKFNDNVLRLIPHREKDDHRETRYESPFTHHDVDYNTTPISSMYPTLHFISFGDHNAIKRSYSSPRLLNAH